MALKLHLQLLINHICLVIYLLYGIPLVHIPLMESWLSRNLSFLLGFSDAKFLSIRRKVCGRHILVILVRLTDLSSACLRHTLNLRLLINRVLCYWGVLIPPKSLRFPHPERLLIIVSKLILSAFNALKLTHSRLDQIGTAHLWLFVHVFQFVQAPVVVGQKSLWNFNFGWSKKSVLVVIWVISQFLIHIWGHLWGAELWKHTSFDRIIEALFCRNLSPGWCSHEHFVSYAQGLNHSCYSLSWRSYYNLSI